MRNQKKRKKMRRKRNRNIAVLGLLAVIGVAMWVQKSTGIGEKNSGYKIEAPKVLENVEIEERLEELANEYEEFGEVYEKRESYSQDMLAALCNNPEMIDFVKGYPDAKKKARGEITREELEEKVPLFIQWDKRWGYASYGNSCIGMSGCAPTCLSMVIVGLKGEKVTPAKVAEFAWKNGYYIEGTGTSWSLMTSGCLEFGITGKEIGLSRETVYQELEQGHPIICSVRAGDFTTQGHFIVLAEIEDGNIKVNDPNSPYRSNQTWDYEQLAGQIKNLWAFS